MHVHTCTRAHTHVHTHTYTHAHICTHTYTHMHACTHTCTHTHRLYVGVGVGVPVVIILVVIVVVLYCGCSRYQNRKMQTLIQAYNARRQREEEERETAIAAPPPYDPLQSDLPPYTEQDPYKQQLSSNQVTFEGELSDNHVTREQIQSGSGTEGENARALPTEVPVGSREREEVESNNGEEQLVSDNAPLLSEPHLN